MSGGARTIVLLLTCVVAISLAACTVKPIGWEQASGGGNGVFDAKAYVQSIWTSKAVPAYDGQAVDATTLLDALASDPAAAGLKYGHQPDPSKPFNYVIKGTANVLSVGALPSGSNGLMVDVAPFDGKADFAIVTGPVILGTALRDVLPFINFNDFINQVDYANVSTQMKQIVKTTVLASFDPGAAVGHKVEFEGAFAMTSLTDIEVVPVKLTVGAGQ
jgi:predicted lipoprotein